MRSVPRDVTLPSLDNGKCHDLLEQVDRLDRVSSRLRTLLRCDTSLQIKGPKALFACELMPLGDQRFCKLRTQAANALLGKEFQSTSSMLACNVLVSKLQDPEEFVLTAVFRAFRRFLLRADEATRTSCLQRVSQHSGNYPHVHGPCGTIAYYLQKQGWQLTSSGDIHLDLPVRFNIPVAIEVARRKSMDMHFHICRSSTANLVSRETPRASLCIARHIVGAFQHEARKALWADIEGKCKLCGADDAFLHGFLECPALESVRIDEDSPLWRCPVVYRHEDADTFLFCVHAGRPLGMSQDQIRSILQPALFQTSTLMARAGWSLVLSLASGTHQKAQEIRDFHDRRVIPPSFKVLIKAATASARSTYANASLRDASLKTGAMRLIPT